MVKYTYLLTYLDTLFTNFFMFCLLLTSFYILFTILYTNLYIYIYIYILFLYVVSSRAINITKGKTRKLVCRYSEFNSRYNLQPSNNYTIP